MQDISLSQQFYFYFQAFLTMHVDDSVTGLHMRRISTAEDDNPPSPIGMDAVDVFSMSQQPSIGSPASRRGDGGLRFPSPMTPPSNPHTPASPARMPGVSISETTCLMLYDVKGTSFCPEKRPGKDLYTGNFLSFRFTHKKKILIMLFVIRCIP